MYVFNQVGFIIISILLIIVIIILCTLADQHTWSGFWTNLNQKKFIWFNKYVYELFIICSIDSK